MGKKRGEKMYLIVGLGNPEEEYNKTRHNMGFHAINKLAKQYKIEITKKKFKGLYGTGEIENQKVILLKPQTYMNLSGESIQEVANYYHIPVENILVIYDDMDIDIGKVKIRKKGGAGSHNGMKSIVNHLKSENFPRIRIGIGTPKDKSNSIYYVIGPIPKEEEEILDQATTKAKDAISEILKSGIDVAMNQFN